jgi:glycosyltransferase involved in cell wall biosynthesis
MISALLVVRWPVGGIRTYVRDLLRADAFADVRFHVVLPRCAEAESLMQEVTNPNVTWQLTEDSVAALLKTVFLLPGLRSYSLIHSHGFTAAFIAALPSRLRRVPHLTTGHDVLVAGQLDGMKGFVWRRVLQSSLLSARKIHCVTHQARDNLIEFLPGLRLHADSIHVIQHGINVSHFVDSVARDLRTEIGVGAATRLIGFLGRFMSQKGFAVLVSAVGLLTGSAKVLPDFRIVVVSYGGFIREEQDRIAALGLSRYFVFLDFVKDAAPTLKGLDLLVMPSLWEASGLLAMESLVCGTPLIGTSCIGLRETIANTPALSVAPGDAAALATAIEQRLIDSGKTEAVQFAATAAGRFDGRTAFAALRRLYDEAIVLR